jgi:hypothetical protein
MAQQARPIGIGQRELLRIQFIAASSRVKITFPSIFESYATGLVSLMQRTYFSARNRQEQICEFPPACRLEFPESSWHACRMDPVKQERRPARMIALTCAVAISLSSCAQRSATSRAATGTPTAPEIAGSQPRRPAAPVPSERKPSLQAIPPRTQPSKVEQIIALVREGRLVNESQGTLVFSKSGLTRSSRSGLYEDAILLARLRRTLQETAGIPESLSATATVRDARASLAIEDTLPASTAASAIDAGLRTPGIIAVQARFGG